MLGTQHFRSGHGHTVKQWYPHCLVNPWWSQNKEEGQRPQGIPSKNSRVETHLGLTPSLGKFQMIYKSTNIDNKPDSPNEGLLLRLVFQLYNALQISWISGIQRCILLSEQFELGKPNHATLMFLTCVYAWALYIICLGKQETTLCKQQWNRSECQQGIP